MRLCRRLHAKTAMVVLLAATLFSTAGCMPVVALIHFVKGNKVPAEYDGLEDKRVAIVCVMSSSPYGQDEATSKLAKRLEATLGKEVSGIEIVPRSRIRDWTDANDWDQVNFTEIGRGVKADMVLAVELSSYTLHNGATLYQGNADVEVTVYDVKANGKHVFSREIPGFQFPVEGGRPTGDVSKDKFEMLFVEILSEKISNYFYAYDVQNDFANDARGLAL